MQEKVRNAVTELKMSRLCWESDRKCRKFWKCYKLSENARTYKTMSENVSQFGLMSETVS